MPQPRILHYSSLVIIIAGMISVYTSGILAQSTTVICLSSFSWMENSKGQNPCLLTAYLQGACTHGQFTVSPLPPDEYYTGPYINQQNPCQCSSVTYNSVSACGLCQNRTIISWSTWKNNCSTSYPVYAPNISSGTAIPQWAFQNVTGSDMFNVTLAQSIGDGPESIATRAQSTATAFVATSAIPSESASLTDVPLFPIPTSSGSGSNTGVIAGSVVGSVVGVALITGVVFLIVKKTRPQIPPSARLTAPPMSPLSTSTFMYVSSTPGSSPPNPYDPSNPNTFPVSAPSTTGVYYTNHSARPDGAYHGWPIV